MNIQNWDDIDQALKQLGLVDYEIEQNEARMTNAIDKIKERYKERLEGKYAESAELIQLIQNFCSRHKSDFAGKQTKNLNFGQVSFRVNKSSYVFLKSESEIADALLRMKKTDCVKVEKKIIKNSLKNLGDSILHKLGIKLVPGTLKWFITPFREKIIPTNEQ